MPFKDHMMLMESDTMCDSLSHGIAKRIFKEAEDHRSKIPYHPLLSVLPGQTFAEKFQSLLNLTRTRTKRIDSIKMLYAGVSGLLTFDLYNEDTSCASRTPRPVKTAKRRDNRPDLLKGFYIDGQELRTVAVHINLKHPHKSYFEQSSVGLSKHALARIIHRISPDHTLTMMGFITAICDYFMLDVYKDAPLPTDDKGNIWVVDKDFGACLLANDGPDNFIMVTYVDNAKLRPEQYATTEAKIAVLSEVERESIERHRQHFHSMSNKGSFHINLSSMNFQKGEHPGSVKMRVA